MGVYCKEERRGSRDCREERTQDSDKDSKISGRDSSASIAVGPEIFFFFFLFFYFTICYRGIRLLALCYVCFHSWCAFTVSYIYIRIGWRFGRVG